MAKCLTPRGEQLLQSHLSVHSARNARERGWSKRLAWGHDMEISVQDRPASLPSQLGTTTACPTAFGFFFLVCFCCCSLVAVLFNKASGSAGLTLPAP